MPMRNKYKLGGESATTHTARPAPPPAPTAPGSAVGSAGDDERSTRKPRGLRRFLERNPFSAAGANTAEGRTGVGGGGSGGSGGGTGGGEPSTSPSGGPPAETSPPGASVLADTSLPTTTAAAGATAARQTMSPPPPTANPMEVIVEDEYSDPVDVRRRQSNEEADADDEEATNAETRVYCEPYDSKSCGDQRKDRDSAMSRDSEQLTPTNFASGTGGCRSACSRSNSMESPANMAPSSGRLSSTGRSSNSSDSRTLADSPAAFLRGPPGPHAPSSTGASAGLGGPPTATPVASHAVSGPGGSAGSSPCSPGARLISSPPSAELQPRPKPFTGAARIPGSAIPIGGAPTAAAAAGGLYSSSPQGNNVITHHPASPFEPVAAAVAAAAGGPPLSIAAMAVAGPIPTGPRRTSLHGVSPLAAPETAAPPPAPAGPQTAVKEAADKEAEAGGESDVYDEAWDVRAVRLGLEFSRVQETDIDSFAAVPKEEQATPEAGPVAAGPGLTGSASGVTLTAATATGAASPTGGTTATAPAPPPAGNSTSGGTGADTDDYDYAYNRAWQLSQEMNRSLSFHQAGSSENASAPISGPPPAVAAPCPPMGPLLVAQEVLDPDLTGSGSASSPVKTRSAQPDTDSLSTDSYDEPWDVRHRRMLEDLTGGGSRFIDHPPNFMTTSMTAQGPHGGAPPPPPPHHPPPGTGPAPTPATAGAANRRRSRNHSGPTRSEAVNPNSPLEDQPWYHSDITRAEAENLLKIHWEGSYLVRRSESNRQDFSLSIKHNKGYLHMKIVRNSRGEFILGQYSQPYNSIPAMIHHYSLSLLPIKGADHMTLQHPVSKHVRTV